jgi:Zn-dependent peptidase ImmA (M78 family)/DNA-binding XRE family transcriptional regulator
MPKYFDRAVDCLFDGQRLTLARHLAGLRKADLAQRVGKSPTAVASWETGAKAPTGATVSELALALGVEPGFFRLRREDLPAISGAPHFRSLRSTTQIARDQATAYGQLALDLSAHLERYVEFPDRDVEAYGDHIAEETDDAPELAARALRQEWQLGSGPLGHVVRLLENHGVLIVFSPRQTAAVDAYSCDSFLRPVVVLNPIKLDYYRQRFDVAHELGHLIMHRDAEPGGRVVEDQAQRFAAELLMPAAQFRDLLPSSLSDSSWRTLARLKEVWGVSLQALLYRARRLGCLSDVSYRNAMTTISARGWRRNEPGAVIVIEGPSLFPRALEILALDGLDEEAFVRETRLPSRLFRTVTSRTPDPVEALPGQEVTRSFTKAVSLFENNV